MELPLLWQHIHSPQTGQHSPSGVPAMVQAIAGQTTSYMTKYKLAI